MKQYLRLGIMYGILSYGIIVMLIIARYTIFADVEMMFISVFEKGIFSLFILLASVCQGLFFLYLHKYENYMKNLELENNE
jgi:hypothetical protein